MQNLLMTLKKEIFPISLIMVLALSRLIPHPWNFSPILALGIFSGFYFKNYFLSLFIVMFSMFLGDVFLGFHSTMFFTYISIAVAVLIGFFIKRLKFTEILYGGLTSSISFFLMMYYY